MRISLPRQRNGAKTLKVSLNLSIPWKTVCPNRSFTILSAMRIQGDRNHKRMPALHAGCRGSESLIAQSRGPDARAWLAADLSRGYKGYRNQPRGSAADPALVGRSTSLEPPINELELLTEALNRTDPAVRAAFLEQA